MRLKKTTSIPKRTETRKKKLCSTFFLRTYISNVTPWRVVEVKLYILKQFHHRDGTFTHGHSHDHRLIAIRCFHIHSDIYIYIYELIYLNDFFFSSFFFLSNAFYPVKSHWHKLTHQTKSRYSSTTNRDSIYSCRWTKCQLISAKRNDGYLKTKYQ